MNRYEWLKFSSKGEAVTWHSIYMFLPQNSNLLYLYRTMSWQESRFEDIYVPIISYSQSHILNKSTNQLGPTHIVCNYWEYVDPVWKSSRD